MDIRSLLRIFRAHRALLIALPLLAAAAGVLVSSLGSSTYSASASLLLRPFDAAEELSPDSRVSPIDFDRYVRNEAEVAGSRTVARIAAPEVGLEPNEALAAVEVVGHETSDIITITGRSDDPDRAVALANGFAEGYLDVRRQGAVEVTQRKIDELEVQLAALEEEMGELSRQIDATPDASAQAATLSLRRDAALGAFTELQARVRQLTAEASLQRGSAEIIERADDAEEVGAVSTASAAAGGIVLGLIAAMAYSLLADRVSERIRSRSDLIELGVRTPVVGELPSDREVAGGRGKRVAMLEHSDGRFAESVRALRTGLVRLDGSSRDRPPVILVASPRAGDGRSLIALNLAVAFAQSGMRTTLVSSDLRDPAIERTLGVRAGAPGLADYVASSNGTRPKELPVATTRIANLALVPAGAIQGNPAEVVGSPVVQELLQDLAGRGSVVILDSPPALDYTDAALLAGSASSVALVVTPGVSADEVRRSLNRLGSENGTKVALVLNRTSTD